MRHLAVTETFQLRLKTTKVSLDILDYIQLNNDEVSEYGTENVILFAQSSFGFADDIQIDNCYVKNKNYDAKTFEKNFKSFIEDTVPLNDEDASSVAANTLDDYMVRLMVAMKLGVWVGWSFNKTAK